MFPAIALQNHRVKPFWRRGPRDGKLRDAFALFADHGPQDSIGVTQLRAFRKLEKIFARKPTVSSRRAPSYPAQNKTDAVVEPKGQAPQRAK